MCTRLVVASVCTSLCLKNKHRRPQTIFQGAWRWVSLRRKIETSRRREWGGIPSPVGGIPSPVSPPQLTRRSWGASFACPVTGGFWAWKNTCDDNEFNFCSLLHSGEKFLFLLYLLPLTWFLAEGLGMRAGYLGYISGKMWWKLKPVLAVIVREIFLPCLCLLPLMWFSVEGLRHMSWPDRLYLWCLSFGQNYIQQNHKNVNEDRPILSAAIM